MVGLQGQQPAVREKWAVLVGDVFVKSFGEAASTIGLDKAIGRVTDVSAYSTHGVD